MDSMADGQGRRLGDGGRFTKESPFEFEGVRVWRDDSRQYPITVKSYPTDFTDSMSVAHVAALQAFIEAEQDVWHKNGEGFSRGRWTAVTDYSPCGWAMTHADFPRSVWRDDQGQWGTNHANIARQMLADFLAWHKAQNPPAKFVTPDVPEVGQWIEATLKDGTVEAFQVTRIETHGDIFLNVMGRRSEHNAFINLSRHAAPMADDITSWRPIDPPAPAEPTGLGAVVEIEWRSGKYETFVLVGPVWISTSSDQSELGGWRQTQKAHGVTVISEGVTR